MKRSITIELDQPAAERLERAARYRKQSPAAFLTTISEEATRQALLDEAVDRYQRDPEALSVSELAAQNGLFIEELMLAIRDRVRSIAAETGRPEEEIVRSWYARSDPDLVAEVFLAASRTEAAITNRPELLERARAAVAAWRQQRAHGGAGAE